MFGSIVIALLAVQSIAVDDMKNRPVSKVITLLNDMVKQLENEAKEDAEAYDTMMCWCTTNDKAKTVAISDGEATIAELTAAIEAFTASSSKLNTEIENLEAELAANTDALDKATSVRQKELAEFNAEEKSSLSTIASLKGAVGAIAKHHDSAFLQSESTEESMDFLTLVSDLHKTLHEHSDAVKQMLTKKQRKTIEAFVQSPDDFLDSGLNAKNRKQALVQAAPSAEIFGVLKQMKEGFETNLGASQAEEMKAQAEYSAVKAAKDKEIAAGQSQIDTKTSLLADTDLKNAQSKKQLAETQATLAADSEFLGKLKEQCALFDKEYSERTTTRQQEIGAVSKALVFLSSDEAQDLVTRTLSFTQKSSISKKEALRRSKVVSALSKVATQFNDPRISSLAIHARLDAFTKVKASIGSMIESLAKEQEEEVAHKDFCIDEINANEKETQAKDQKKNTLQIKVEDLTETIDKLGKLIEELKAKIADLQLQLKRAGEDREKENTIFQTTVADQRATQKLLIGALNVLKGFYEKSALVQKTSGKKQPAGPPPPPGFKAYSNSAASGGVMGMINQIIEDAKSMEGDAIKAEETAQTAYETFVTETNAAITAATKEQTTSEENKAAAEVEKAETIEKVDSTMAEIESLYSENADLHKSCDYTLKNFDLRQAARQSESEALKQALALLSGASFSAFLQHH
jgi:DNA repair exonuclease SbcCD ATPase subunit